ncbi:hypothetical protein E4T47_07817 [Aureobasidium subglaciale]|nr:hypothetical protein E4T47_07817 [Aureobasidium subglaciale]
MAHNADKMEKINSIDNMMSVERHEKLYLSPKTPVVGDLPKRFANPTPLPLLGFLVASFPLGCALMGWRGAGGGGAATIGTFYFFGGMLQMIGCLLEWFIGNTFSFVVFGSFGAFWLAFAITLTPFYNAEGAFTSTATTSAETAAGVAKFDASFGYFQLIMGIIVFMYLICSLRINIVFFAIFFFLDIALFLLAAANWKAASGAAAAAGNIQIAAGAFVFAFCILGLYLLFVQLLEAVEFPINLPVGDLSTRFKRKKSRQEVEIEA